MTAAAYPRRDRAFEMHECTAETSLERVHKATVVAHFR